MESDLHEKFPPSEPCTCEVCTSYCKRPGWWTVKEARMALESGLAPVKCHLEIENDWNTLAGQELVSRWIRNRSMLPVQK